jgi:hypothetical protein
MDRLDNGTEDETKGRLMSGNASVYPSRNWKYSLDFILNPIPLEDFKKLLKLLEEQNKKVREKYEAAEDNKIEEQKRPKRWRGPRRIKRQPIMSVPVNTN